MNKEPSLNQLIAHTAMGAVLGVLLAFALILTNRHLFELIADSPSPGFLIAVLIGVSSSMIAAGATLSGFIFSAIEMNAPPAKRRAIRPLDKREDSRK
jgi:NhaP-type Na+/H+ or K+/H+ antiporter